MMSDESVSGTMQGHMSATSESGVGVVVISAGATLLAMTSQMCAQKSHTYIYSRDHYCSKHHVFFFINYIFQNNIKSVMQQRLEAIC